jgi:hypothetical protein
MLDNAFSEANCRGNKKKRKERKRKEQEKVVPASARAQRF